MEEKKMKKIFTFVPLLTLFGFTASLRSNETNNSSFYVHINKGFYLSVADKVINSIFVLSSDDCWIKCSRISLCKSFNQETGKRKGEMVLCEMLSTNKYEHSSQLQPKMSFDHYTLQKLCQKNEEQNMVYHGDSCQEPESCVHVMLRQRKKTSGVYRINPDGQGSFSVYCDMETDGGGWTVLQRRQDGTVNFTRGWDDYKKGFGTLEGEFWLGNDKIHRLSASQETELRFDLEDFEGNKKYATYQNLKVQDLINKYRIFFGAYSGTAGDSLTFKHYGKAFSTIDRDNDESLTDSCALMYSGAWWYGDCHEVNINGKYGSSSYATGVNWKSFKGYTYSLKKTTMKIRPK